MIFMQQKHFNNPRIYNNHRTTTNRVTTPGNTVRQQRPSSAVQLSENQFLTSVDNNNVISAENRTIRNANGFTLNQRLTSVGGLFATLSIIITGALLYAIFTAKSQDKWYYISAVLINISLLLILMIGAILFDKYYLKKYPTNSASNTITSSPISSSTSSSSNTNHNLINSAQNRIATVNPVHYPNSYVQNSLISTESVNSIDYNHENNITHYFSRNDVPPQYPELSSFINLNDKDKDSTRRNHLLNQTNTNLTTTVNVINETNNDKSQHTSQLKLDSPLNQPPNYFDLYPISNNSSNNHATATITISTSLNPGSSSVLHI